MNENNQATSELTICKRFVKNLWNDFINPHAFAVFFFIIFPIVAYVSWTNLFADYFKTFQDKTFVVFLAIMSMIAISIIIESFIFFIIYCLSELVAGIKHAYNKAKHPERY
jgi:phosphotransferase system  glucose/maltose/N-acetylglucosamine-specific IIC component